MYKDSVFVRVSSKERPLCVRSEIDLARLLDGGEQGKPTHTQMRKQTLPACSQAAMVNVSTSSSLSVLTKFKQQPTQQTAGEVTLFLSNDDNADILNTAALESTPCKQ